MAMQVCTVALGLLMLLEPSLRTPAARIAASVLMVCCGLIFAWHLHRAGTAHLTLPALWKRTRETTDSASLGMGPLDLLSVFMAVVATSLP